MKIAFHDNQLCERGTTVALYDYARYNEELLGHTSVILYPRADPRNHAAVEERFHKRFGYLPYDSLEEVEEFVRRESIDAVYWIRFGTKDPLVRSCRNLVHSVFANEPHGDRYAFVSEWMSRHYDAKVPYVPHMIDLPSCGEDLRSTLGIPGDAIVLGRYGGRDTFDIPFVHEVVDRFVRRCPDVYFLFANTDRFSGDHPRIVHVDILLEPIEKVRFVNTCDAMLHARERGETFGLAVGEFSSLNKPVLTYSLSAEKAHIQILGDKGVYYDDAAELDELLRHIRKVIRRRHDWNGYRPFTPERVMTKFRDVFLVESGPRRTFEGERKRQSNLVNSTFAIYCINLARHPERWRRSREEFEKYGLKVDRFEAVDGDAIEFGDLLRTGIVGEAFDPIERRKKGALGIIGSSAALWRKIALGGEDRWALLCEDDIRFHPDFLDLFEEYWSEVPPDAEIVYFGFQYPWGCDPFDESILSNISVPVGKNVVRLKQVVNGTHAYAINTNSARKLLSEHLPLSTAVDKFPPHRFNVYAFKRPPGTGRRTVEDLYVDNQLWEGQQPVSQYGLISTRAERSTIGHLPYHYLWFARRERQRRNYQQAFEYLMRIKRNPSMYDAATNNFDLWHEMTVTAFYVDRREGVNAFEELIKRRWTEETRAGLLRHEDDVMDCVEHYRLPDLTIRLRDAIAQLTDGAG